MADTHDFSSSFTSDAVSKERELRSAIKEMKSLRDPPPSVTLRDFTKCNVLVIDCPKLTISKSF